MYRTHNCGELQLSDKNKSVTISGWVHKVRNKGFIVWVDLRDRYGVTQIVFDQKRTSEEVFEKAQELGREFVIKVTGEVIERESKNPQIHTGEVEILASQLEIINAATAPPFTIEDLTDGGEDLRMKYRYLDLRRKPLQENLILRHLVAKEARDYLSNEGFIEIETPYLIKSTPEGARDFVVPSRMNSGQFYALPQSPQTFKQLLMVSGMDKYFQIVRCFRDEDLRSDRQPEFTQIDCEMSFVNQEDVMNTFENMMRHILKKIRNIDAPKFPRMTYQEAMASYGSDKPDIRFDLKLYELNDLVKNSGFKVFEQPLVVGISVPQVDHYTRKDIDELIEWVKRPQIGANGLIWVRCAEDGTYKSSVDKFFDPVDLKSWSTRMNAKPGDLLLIMAGETDKTRQQLGSLRLHLGEKLGLRDPDIFAPLWVVDFPLLEWDEDSKRYHAMHHPFTSPKLEDIHLMEKDPGKVRANAYDIVLNGNEIGGGSIRIHDSNLQELMFSLLGFTKEEASHQFGFLMNAFKYGAPPHGGIAFGFDRLVAILGGQESIRDFIAFPKNNAGQDVMINAPTTIDKKQLEELSILIKPSS